MSRFRISLMLTALSAAGLAAPRPAAAQFDSHNVSLYSWMDLSTFGAGRGNDCWGYVSPSGREYALMGLDNKAAFVEITDPQNPVIVGTINHASCLWCDIKVYDHYAYIVTVCGSGIQVADMGDIDNGVVTLVRTVSSPLSSHNVAIDTFSGYLYTAGGAIFDLSDPANPVPVGTMSGWHDAQVVTYRGGQYDGREIVFASRGRGALEIIDVTDKSNTFRISRTYYPNQFYTHQAWTEDLQYLYIDDELDNIPRTTVMDITDLANPVFLGDFTSGLSAVDHNLYVRDGFIYEANYKSGLRIFDARSDPVSPAQVGFFDTYPGSNSGGFEGAWGVYPFFPSRTVIVSDRNRGLFILDPSDALSGRLGDLNCDGFFDGADIDPFFLALGDPAAWQAQYPDCDINNGDVNGDNALDGADIDRFFECLVIGCADCNNNDVADEYDIANGTSPDCNGNGVPDECDVASGSSADCDANGLPDECENLAPLEITAHPQDAVVCAGDRLTLTVVTNRPPLRYQWHKDRFPIPGAGSDTYVVDPVALKDAADYFVVVSDNCDLLMSGVATVSVADRPTIHVQPTGQTVCVGDAAAFVVFATGGSLSYQWRRDGADIPGATSTIYVIGAVTLSDAGVYDAAVTNDCATVLSDSAVLTVESCFEPGDLNCDGAFDGADIDPFFLALVDAQTYEAQYPHCDRMLADMNADASFDGADIDTFFECLVRGCP